MHLAVLLGQLMVVAGVVLGIVMVVVMVAGAMAFKAIVVYHHLLLESASPPLVYLILAVTPAPAQTLSPAPIAISSRPQQPQLHPQQCSTQCTAPKCRQAPHHTGILWLSPTSQLPGQRLLLLQLQRRLQWPSP